MASRDAMSLIIRGGGTQSQRQMRTSALFRFLWYAFAASGLPAGNKEEPGSFGSEPSRRKVTRLGARVARLRCPILRAGKELVTTHPLECKGRLAMLLHNGPPAGSR